MGRRRSVAVLVVEDDVRTLILTPKQGDEMRRAGIAHGVVHTHPDGWRFRWATQQQVVESDSPDRDLNRQERRALLAKLRRGRVTK